MAIRNDYEIAEQISARELYHFYIGDGSWFDYRYTNRDEDWADPDVPSTIYTAIPIKSSKIKQTMSTVSNAVQIEVHRDNPVAAAFISVPPHGGVTLDLAVGYDSDLGSITDPENMIFWKGTVTSASFKGNKAFLTCESKFKVLDRLALRRRVAVHCPYALYSPTDCRLSKLAFSRLGTITEVFSPLSLEMEEEPMAGGGWQDTRLDSVYEHTTHYHGGTLHYTDNVTGFKYIVGIESYTYDLAGVGNKSTITVNIDHPLPNIGATHTVTLAPGCTRQVLACHFKFNNYANFGGVPYLTSDEPFATVFRTPLN